MSNADHPLPDQMLCIEISEPGPDPDGLRPTRRPLPEPGTGEVLIQVAAAGVNRPDLVQRQGHYPPPPGASDIPGLECAGTIVAAGADVMGWSAGDDVVALVTGGGYGEYCVAPAPQLLAVPKGLSMIEAAALPETFFTVWVNVFDRGGLKPGETLLVHGGASGIGTTAIMVAKCLGSNVIVTAGSDEKCAACRELGADLAINYKKQDFVEQVLAFTDDQGADVILDMVGGDYIPRNQKCLAVDGRISIIALQGGRKAEIDLNRILMKRQTITGSTLRARTVAFKGGVAKSLAEHVWPLIDAGKIRPLIHATVPLGEAAEGHRILEAGDHIGKVVLTVGEARDV